MNKEEIKELFELLFNDNLTDFGKRKLQEYVEIMHQKLDNVEMVKRFYKKILFKNSDLSLENTNLKQALNDIRGYAIKEKEFNDNQIQEYKTCIETNANGKFNEQEKENMEHCMTVNICINYKMNDILQIIDEVLGGEK